MSANSNIIGITMGDPAGVGPEVICKALSDMLPEQRARVRIFGNREVLQRAAKVVGAELDFSERSNGISVEHIPFDGDIPPFGKLDRKAGDASFRYIESSVRAAQRISRRPKRSTPPRAMS